jgi:hypothetical protein
MTTRNLLRWSKKPLQGLILGKAILPIRDKGYALMNTRPRVKGHMWNVHTDVVEQALALMDYQSRSEY